MPPISRQSNSGRTPFDSPLITSGAQESGAVTALGMNHRRRIDESAREIDDREL
jgi:hypothetical protein